MIYHVIPEEDLQPHEKKMTCACDPSVDTLENGDMVVTHNLFDCGIGDFLNDKLNNKI